jgi:hypothetical protein
VLKLDVVVELKDTDVELKDTEAELRDVDVNEELVGDADDQEEELVSCRLSKSRKD